MAALRGLGRDTEAATELAALDRRELVAIVPELLIEKSALAIRQSGEVGHALDMIERAVQVLTKFPVSPDLDRDLVRRALVQAHHIGDQADHVLSLPAAAACHAGWRRLSLTMRGYFLLGEDPVA
jgi:hypothetical protein